jgi:hypothetical protein
MSASNAMYATSLCNQYEERKRKRKRKRKKEMKNRNANAIATDSPPFR